MWAQAQDLRISHEAFANRLIRKQMMSNMIKVLIPGRNIGPSLEKMMRPEGYVISLQPLLKNFCA